ncbi:MAG: ribokinase [Planctomycetes bacterium]|nr:ribokinase [Planctomycetota bacterium]
MSLTRPPRICVVGSANIDLTIRTSRLPEPGETLAAYSLQTGFGGKGANQAVMAARLGAQVSVIAKVGDDIFGSRTFDNFRRLGMDVKHVTTASNCATGTAVIMVDGSGQNRILLIGGANDSLTAGDVEQAAPELSTADIVLGQLEVPIEATLAAFRIAKAAGVRTILNPAPARPLPPDILACTDILIPNETELRALTNHEITSATDRISACRLLLEHGPRQILVTLGEHGALLVDKAGDDSVPGFSVAACDTTGAGDAFIASLSVFWAEGFALCEAAKRAHAAAALSVTRPGAQASYPNRQEVDAFLGEPGA